jgi:ribosomal protein S18 acetylase RimI-like enzyme
MEPMFKLVENAEEKFTEYLNMILTKDTFSVFVAEENSLIAGYVIASVSVTPEVFVIRRRLYIQDMIVNPDYRRAGIAKQLMDAIFVFAKEQQVEKMDLLVAVKNDGANKFWRAMGFEPALNYMTMYLV